MDYKLTRNYCPVKEPWNRTAISHISYDQLTEDICGNIRKIYFQHNVSYYIILLCV